MTGAFILIARRAPTPARAACAGVLAGLAVTTEYPTLLLAAVFGLVLAWRRPVPILALAAYAAGTAAGIAPALLYHATAFGSPFTTGYAFKVDPGHAQIIASGASGVVLPSWERFAGVMLSARRGLLFYSPLLALGIAGIAARRRRAPREAWAMAAACGVYLLFGASFVDWQGGWCAAARHLTPIVPLLALAVAWGVQELGARSWFAIAFTVLAGVSAAHQALSVMVTPLFPEIFDRPLAQMAARSLADRAAMPNLVSDVTGLPAWGVAIAWALLLIGVVVMAVRSTGMTGSQRAWLPSLALAAAITAIGVQAALSSRLTADQEHARAFVLDRLGYHDLARSVDPP